MNEKQVKPGRKGVHGWPALSIMLVSLLLTVFIIISVKAVSCNEGYGDFPPEVNYNTARNEIENAITAYSASHNQSFPTLSGTYTNTNCSNCSVINISALITFNITAHDVMLRYYPNGLNLSASGNDNCGGNASLGCKNGSSYIWIVGTYGDVYSYCAGAGCKTNNSDYQGVWP